MFASFGNSVVGGIQFFLMSWAGYHVLRDLRAEVFGHVHRLSLGYFTKNEAGDVMSRFTNDTDTLQQIMGFGLVSVIQGGLLIVWIVYNMLAKSVAFALVSLITLPLMFIATRWFSESAMATRINSREAIGRYATSAIRRPFSRSLSLIVLRSHRTENASRGLFPFSAPLS